jgi:hypothetical protein
MMKTGFKRTLINFTVQAVVACATLGLFTSCVTNDTAVTDSSSYTTDAFSRFWVLLYKPAIKVAPWTPAPERATDPDGAALNIVAAMQCSDVEAWLANWNASERPKLSATEQAALVQHWQALQGSNIEIRGRVVAGLIVVVELSLVTAEGGKERVQIPLQKSENRWWLTSLEPNSEYLKWESSPNKKVQYIDPDGFKKRQGMKSPERRNDAG